MRGNIHEEKKTRASLRFPDVQFNSLPTDRRALLSERLEQARWGFLYSKEGLRWLHETIRNDDF